MESLLLPAVVLWGLVSGWIAAWFSHRYRIRTDDDGFESAELSDARCPHCDHVISLPEAMPVRSITCASCSDALPSTWWGTHLAVVLTSVAMWWTFGASWVLVPFLWLAPVVVAAAAIDLRTLLIPKRIVWVGFWVGLASIVGASLLLDIPSTIQSALIGSVGFFGFLLIFNLIYPAGMGFGDVRLAILLGLYLGWIDLRLPIYALLISSIVSVIGGVAQRVIAKADNSGGIPFGPGLAVGTVVALVFSQSIVG